MRRNQLIAAMSSGVFVVESVRDGGAVYTASVAQSLGKPVFALSKKRLGKETEGNRQLLESGATPVRCFADVERIIAGMPGGATNVRQP
jgi:predicted Rossmann fold nucleotide-binding protein DprA/Smf involved in DNA uptake